MQRIIDIATKVGCKFETSTNFTKFRENSEVIIGKTLILVADRTQFDKIVDYFPRQFYQYKNVEKYHIVILLEIMDEISYGLLVYENKRMYINTIKIYKNNEFISSNTFKFVNEDTLDVEKFGGYVENLFRVVEEIATKFYTFKKNVKYQDIIDIFENKEYKDWCNQKINNNERPVFVGISDEKFTII